MTAPKKKKKSEQVVDLQQHEQEVVQEPPKEEAEPRSFDDPMPMDADLARMYEEHKKALAGVSGPYVPRTTPEEDKAMFSRMGRLSKRDRSNPERNLDLMPEKQVVEEELPGGDPT